MNGSVIFAHDGEAGFSGIWSLITAARSLDDYLINPAKLHNLGATHVARYSTGGTAALKLNETLTGGTSSATCKLVYQIVEQGTAGSADSGWIFVKALSGPFQAETLTGTGTGTVVIFQDFRTILPASPAKAALISVEVASVNFSMSGSLAGTTALSNMGHKMDLGQSYVVRGWSNIKSLSIINSVASSGAIVKYSLFY
jgi:hypothetical protein